MELEVEELVELEVELLVVLSLVPVVEVVLVVSVGPQEASIKAAPAAKTQSVFPGFIESPFY